MSDLTTRQAELEELRRRQIANNNAKALDEKGSITLNMMDWQAQQRALKAADRQMKNQAAATLHSFQNTAVESSTLSALQKEDREKKRMSQEQLHQYRAAFTGTTSRQTVQRPITDTLEPTMDVMSGIHVSDAVANLNYKPGEMDAGICEAPTYFSATTYANPDGSDFQFEEKIDKTLSSEEPCENAIIVSFAPDLILEDDFGTDSPPQNREAFDPMSTPVDDIVLVDVPNSDLDEWVSVAQHSDEVDQMTTKHSNRYGHQTFVVQEPVFVNFTFDLVTKDQPPNVEKYLRAAAFIVGVQTQATLKSLTCTGSDPERPGVYKYSVTCSLPVELPGHTQTVAKLHVLGLIRAAIHDGSFGVIANTH